MRILAVSGSLRARSSNTAVLEAARALAPAGVEVIRYEGIGSLPHFNPDDDVDPPPAAVAEWRAAIASADALLICSPEYARGVVGSLKNALDWLVSGFEVIGKPIASINASAIAVTGQEALLATLRTIGVVIEDASIRLPLSGTQRTREAILEDPVLAGALRDAVERLAAATRR
jgi:chromate reductase, NAD(P)H dehydrogenase (quinone)